tara:strand:- start:3335 stop:3565 length:231 start_codon:yes stop_codon:yes gene_type:complete
MGASASITDTDGIAIQGPMSPFVQEASLIKCAGSFSEEIEDNNESVSQSVTFFSKILKNFKNQTHTLSLFRFLKQL